MQNQAHNIDKAILTKWLKAYDIEALQSADDKSLDERIEGRVNRITHNNYWVLVVDGEPVSLSSFNARVNDSVQIGPVWTPPEHRNHGMLVHL